MHPVGKAVLGGAGLFALSAGVLVAQDAMVVGGSSLPPGVAPAAPTDAPAPAYAPVSSAPAPLTAPPPAPASTPPAASPFAPSQGLPAYAAASPQPTFAVAAPFPQQPSFGQPARAPSPAPVPAESRGYYPEGHYPGRLDKGASLHGGLRGPVQLAQVSGGSSLPPGVSPPAGGTTVPPTASDPRPNRPRSWSERLGLGNISTKVFGHAKGGLAARDQDLPLTDEGWEADGILDGYLAAEVSAITQGGLEYGVALGLRGAYDGDGPLFGGQVGGCPLGAVCPGQVTLGTQDFALRGHTSQLFTGLDAYDHESRLALETAHLFLRTGYGDITVGREVGAAELFSLGAPTVLELGLSNGRADYTSLSVAKSTNDPTAFAEKIAYTSPRLGGDRIGVGLQVGASYTPDVDACGAYTCFRRNGSEKAAGSIGPVLEDAWEFGAAFDRTVGDLKAEITATYATARQKESLAAFDDLTSWGLGAEVEWRDFTLGGGYLSSNNGLADGDYTSWDIGLAWRSGDWGASAAYAFAEDENVDVTSDEFTLGLSRSFGDFHVGTGVQYIEREAPYLVGGVATLEEESATAVFVETGWSFE